MKKDKIGINIDIVYGDLHECVVSWNDIDSSLITQTTWNHIGQH